LDVELLRSSVKDNETVDSDVHTSDKAQLAFHIAILATALKHQSGIFQPSIHRLYHGQCESVNINVMGQSQRVSPAYVAVIKMFLSQYTLTGFNVSAHMTEEDP